MKKYLTLLVLSTFLIVVLINIGDLGEIIDETTKQQNIIDLGSIKNCDISQAICSVRSKINTGQSIKVSLSASDRIKSLTPFVLNLTLEGLSKDKINEMTVNYEMQDMDMGDNSQFFKLVATESEMRSQWRAQSTLSLCLSGRADWLATITISIENKQLILRLPIIVKR